MAAKHHPNSSSKNQNQPPKAPKLPKVNGEQRAADHYFTGSVGHTLRQRRLELGLGYKSISAETKIQPKYLEAIEHSAWNRLPHTVHALGFVRTYARALGLDGEVAATKYLLERGPLATTPARVQAHRVARPIVGTRVLIGGAILLAVLAVVGYLLIQLSVLAAPPKLEVVQPPGDVEVKTNSYELKGNTTPSASVSVDGSALAVGDNGQFSTTISLQDGLNTIRVESTNRAGKTARVERNILVKH